MNGCRPRQVFCVIDDAYGDLDRARAVTRGSFDLGGTALRLGTRPDWLNADFPADDEWRIELSKFYYGLDLAHAYAQSGHSVFLDCWLDLVLSWIDQVPVDHDPTDVIARRIQNWIYAWARFDTADDGSPPFESGPAERILTSIAAQVAYLRNNLAAERNHRTLELYALFICALAHPALDRDGELARFSAFELYRNLRADVLADGVHRERSTHYHAIALRSFLGTRINADRFNIDLPTGFDERLASACEFLANVMRPDGTLPMLSDSDDGDYRDLLHLAADHLNRADLRWVATKGKQGETPTERTTSFVNGGYYIQRSGWGEGETPYEAERQLIFDCGPVGDSGHGHYDALHVEVSAGGQPLLMDPGRFTYSEGDGTNWRQWFKGTAAHNTVCVDRLDQVTYRRGKPKGPTSQAQFLELSEQNGVVSFLGEVVSPQYDAIHRRRVLFVANQWWVIEDTLVANQHHRYDLRFHLAPTAEGRTRLLEPCGVTAPGLHLLFPSGPAKPTIEKGWVAPTYGSREPAPVISLVSEATSARFLTVVIPAADDAHPPRVLSSSTSHVEIGRGPTIDRVTWGAEALGWRQW